RERLVVASGTVTLDFNSDLGVANSEEQTPKRDSVRFDVSPNSFFTILVFNGVLRGPEPGAVELSGGNTRILPDPLNASGPLVIEKGHPSDPYDMTVRDSKTGFLFFNVAGNTYDYDSA